MNKLEHPLVRGGLVLFVTGCAFVASQRITLRIENAGPGAIASIVATAATLLLAAVTTQMARSTQKMAQATRLLADETTRLANSTEQSTQLEIQRRQDEISVRVVPTGYSERSGACQLKVKNVQRGPALNVSVSWRSADFCGYSWLGEIEGGGEREITLARTPNGLLADLPNDLIPAGIWAVCVAWDGEDDPVVWAVIEGAIKRHPLWTHVRREVFAQRILGQVEERIRARSRETIPIIIAEIQSGSLKLEEVPQRLREIVEDMRARGRDPRLNWTAQDFINAGLDEMQRRLLDTTDVIEDGERSQEEPAAPSSG